MTLNIGKEVAALQRMTVRELRTRYAEVFGEETRGRQQGLADQADRVAAAIAGRRRPFRTSPPAGGRVGQRRRRPTVAAQGQACPGRTHNANRGRDADSRWRRSRATARIGHHP